VDQLFSKLQLSGQEREEIINLNPILKDVQKLPAGTILNLSLYKTHESQEIATSMKRVTIKRNNSMNSKLKTGFGISSTSLKSTLNNDSEITALTETYNLNLE